MKRIFIYNIMIIMALILTFYFLLTNDMHSSDKIGFIEGCYKGPDFLNHPEIRISNNGNLIYRDRIFNTRIYEDKKGVSIVGSRRVFFEVDNKYGLSENDESPYLMSFSENYDSFFIPDEHMRYIKFYKIDCEKK